ncbi:MAG: FtsX-like permease family protein, partial [Chloroflexota bacterium]
DVTFVGTVHDLRLQPGRINTVIPAYVSQRTLTRLGLSDAYNEIDLEVNRNAGVSVDVIAEDIREELERRGQVVQNVTINRDAEHWSASVVAGLSTVLVAAGLGSLLLSAFLVVNTISGIMAAQKRQIGVMKIIGASRPQIVAVYLVMIGVLGVAAFLIAFPLSVVMGQALTAYFSDFLNYNPPPLRIDAQIVAMEFAVAVLVPIISALQPVLAGTRITAAEAITDHVVASRNNPFDLLLARLGGLPRPALISVRNTFRRKIRLLVTVFTLTMAGAFFISIMNVRNGLLADVNELLRMNDFDVQLQLAMPTDQAGLDRRVRSFPGVLAAESWTNASVVYERADGSDSPNYALTGLYHDSVFVDPPITAGRWLLPPEENDPYEIVVTDEIMIGEPSLAVGDIITLRIGPDEEDFRLVGVVNSEFEEIYSHMDIVSGAGHDACWINDVAPTAMVMCPCVDGLSHNEAEEISPEW